MLSFSLEQHVFVFLIKPKVYLKLTSEISKPIQVFMQPTGTSYKLYNLALNW